MTGLIAGGANVLVFTTGRGSVLGLKPTPWIKVATNTPMYERMIDDMDLDAGPILEGEPVESVGRRLFEHDPGRGQRQADQERAATASARRSSRHGRSGPRSEPAIPPACDRLPRSPLAAVVPRRRAAQLPEGRYHPGYLLWRALPEVVPGVKLRDSFLGQGIANLSHVENLAQRLPIVLAAAFIAAAAIAVGRDHRAGRLASRLGTIAAR